MSDLLKPIENSESAFSNDDSIVHEHIKPIDQSEEFVSVNDQNIEFENKEPEEKVPLTDFIQEEKPTEVQQEVQQQFAQENVEVVEEIVEEEVSPVQVVQNNDDNFNIPAPPSGFDNSILPKTEEDSNEKPKEVIADEEILEKVKRVGKSNKDLMDNQPKKGNFVNKLLVLILILIIGFVAGKFGLDYFYTHDSHASVVDNVSFLEETKEIEVYGLKFTVPTNLNIETWIEYFTIGNSSDDYVMRVDILEYDFQNLLDNYTHLTADVTATYNGKAKVETFNDKEYIVTETAKLLSKQLTAYTKGADNKMLFITIINKKNTYDHKLLEKMAEIINTVEDAKKSTSDNS